jgi:hypothetical protein
MKPMTNRIKTKNEHAAASSGPTSTHRAPRDLADRTLIVPPPKCQSALLH